MNGVGHAGGRCFELCRNFVTAGGNDGKCPGIGAVGGRSCCNQKVGVLPLLCLGGGVGLDVVHVGSVANVATDGHEMWLGDLIGVEAQGESLGSGR